MLTSLHVRQNITLRFCDCVVQRICIVGAVGNRRIGAGAVGKRGVHIGTAERQIEVESVFQCSSIGFLLVSFVAINRQCHQSIDVETVMIQNSSGG